MKTETAPANYEVVQVPTKEGRIFAGKKVEVIADNLTHEAACKLAASQVYFDELIKRYSVRLMTAK